MTLHHTLGLSAPPSATASATFFGAPPLPALPHIFHQAPGASCPAATTIAFPITDISNAQDIIQTPGHNTSHAQVLAKSNKRANNAAEDLLDNTALSGDLSPQNSPTPKCPRPAPVETASLNAKTGKGKMGKGRQTQRRWPRQRWPRIVSNQGHPGSLLTRNTRSSLTL